jgi:GTP-binding protein YchF
MALNVGIVGLPNAGKSTLFNALTQAGAQVGNYPFTTIEPNTGVVAVPDERLDRLAAIFSPPRVIPASVTFTDIAGLVRGASQGEGLGNQFLGHIRECDAIVVVARGFEDPDVSHVEGAVDPVRDLDVIELELQLADLETVTRRLDKREKTARLQKEKAEEALEVMRRVRDHLDAGEPVRTLALSDEERGHIHELYLLTSHPLIVVVNVGEADAGKPPPTQWSSWPAVTVATAWPSPPGSRPRSSSFPRPTAASSWPPWGCRSRVSTGWPAMPTGSST